MTVDSRDILGVEASKLLRRAALFEEIRVASPEVIVLVGLGLLRLRYEDRPHEGYLITPMGADVVHGVGPVRLAVGGEPGEDMPASVS